MSTNLSKLKKEELILRMQGSKDEPRLKYVRENILKIKTAGELAEILDITRQTMSRIENCINKLNGAQYLAICGLIEKNKHEELEKLVNGDIDKREVYNYLCEISRFYNYEFALNILRMFVFKDKEAYIGLKTNTCLNNWLSCLNYNNILSKEEEEDLLRNGFITISIESPNDIVIANKLFNKFKSLEGDIKGILAVDYNDILNAFSYIKNIIIRERTFDMHAIDFIHNISLLKKNKNFKICNEYIYATVMARSNCNRFVNLIQDYKKAKENKVSLMKSANKLKENKDNILNTVDAIFSENIEFLYYENEHFKRHIFDLEEIRKLSTSDDNKDNYYNENITEKINLNNKANEIFLDDNLVPEEKNEEINKVANWETMQKMENEMNIKLEELMQDCSNCLKPNT